MLVFFRLGVGQCYVWGFVFLRLRVSFLTSGVLSVLRLGVNMCYDWGLVFLLVRVSQCYVKGVSFLTFGC